MAVKKVGKQSVKFLSPPVVTNTFSIVGPKEGQGPLGQRFDTVLEDTFYGEKTWEKTESKLFREAVFNVLNKAGLQPTDVDLVVGGDLLDQIVSANFAMREVEAPFLGLYGACSTLAEGLVTAAMVVDGGFADRVLVVTGSHHDTAERQYRFPTELGVQRPPTAQWTVTGVGSCLLQSQGQGPRVTSATVGRVIDLGAKDPNDMGTAMAPAAADTLRRHLRDFAKRPEDYDLIMTGDLGAVGVELVRTILRKDGIELGDRFQDGGLLIYDREKQDVHAGGSGCGCSAVVYAGHLTKLFAEGKLRKLLLAATGALLSPVTYQQGETIPCVCHAVSIEVC
ncbi:MAG TPA: stage V sporulation protein AD [Firmicutes bacterium]|nr:stage V sporulation protein AD [Bacillota bacterium]